MHVNEIEITDVNKDELLLEAEKLGKRHLEALKEQMRRQAEK